MTLRGKQRALEDAHAQARAFAAHGIVRCAPCDLEVDGALADGQAWFRDHSAAVHGVSTRNVEKARQRRVRTFGGVKSSTTVT